MKRIDKLGEMIVRGITLPLRVCVGIYNTVEKNTPETLNDMFPYEIKRKENEDGSTRDKTISRGEG